MHAALSDAARHTPETGSHGALFLLSDTRRCSFEKHSSKSCGYALCFSPPREASKRCPCDRAWQAEICCKCVFVSHEEACAKRYVVSPDAQKMSAARCAAGKAQSGTVQTEQEHPCRAGRTSGDSSSQNARLSCILALRQMTAEALDACNHLIK